MKRTVAASLLAACIMAASTALIAGSLSIAPLTSQMGGQPLYTLSATLSQGNLASER